MARIELNGTVLYYEETGCGQETIVFSHGLLMSSRMFEQQVRALSESYRCIAYDHRGQGLSEVAVGGYDLDSLTEDAVALIESMSAAPCHFIGLSMGGFVGLRLAIKRPELLRTLTLVETSADAEPPASARRYRMLAHLARWVGFRPLAGKIMKILFGSTFLSDPERLQERDLWRTRLVNNDRQGTLRATWGVIDRDGVHDKLQQITTPTLVVVGDEDIATPLLRAERMHENIQGSKLEVIQGAGHTSTVETPEAVNQAIATFLLEHTQTVD
jgi:pimeloyl-ACP methyl ester carboxylesterase